MTEHDEKPFTLSREDLYELVWSKPMRDLAKEFGISDVGLAKRCRRLGIPVPGRGYWARFDAGQQLHRPTLPDRDPQWFDVGALTVAPSQDRSTFLDSEVEQGSNSAGSIAELDELWLKEKLAFEELPANAIAAPVVTRKWDPAIEQCRHDLEEAAETLRASKKAADKQDKWPEWRKRIETDHDGYAWRSVRDRGQRLHDTHKAICFRVSLGTYRRAISIVNALALAAAERGFAVREDEKEGRIVFAGHSAEIQLRVTEPLETKTRPRTRYDGKIEQEKYYIATGRLRVTLQIDYREGPIFEDRDSLPLESQLNRIFCGIYRQVIRAWREERKHQAFQRKHEEEARQRAEAARLQAESEQALAEARRRQRRLAAEAIRWAYATRIRDYVAHIRASASERLEVSSTLTDWIDWALRMAAEIDPTERRLVQATQNSKGDQQD